MSYRWYQNNKLDPNTIPPTSCEYYTQGESRREIRDLPSSSLPATTISNPLEYPTIQDPRPTETLPACTVLHTAEAALRPILQFVQTQEQLDRLLHGINGLQ